MPNMLSEKVCASAHMQEMCIILDLEWDRFYPQSLLANVNRRQESIVVKPSDFQLTGRNC